MIINRPVICGPNMYQSTAGDPPHKCSTSIYYKEVQHSRLIRLFILKSLPVYQIMS